MKMLLMFLILGLSAVILWRMGSVNAGKALVINEDGNVVPGDAGSSVDLNTFEIYSELESFLDVSKNNVKYFGVNKDGTDYGGPLSRMAFGRAQVQLASNGVIRCIQTLDYSTNDEGTATYSRTGIYSDGSWTWGDWQEFATMDKVFKNSGTTIETLYNNSTGAFLETDMNLTATRSGILKVSFNKKETGNTFNIYINDIHKYAYPNWWGENVYETAYVPVNEGDNIRISSDVFEGGDRYRIVNVLII